jgi:cation diffusion facilitator CzcD-associated flavoprotein CzcO
MSATPQTVIVGASATGLAVARCLEEAGLAPILIEAQSEVGSMWRHAYRRLHLHTPRDRSGLPYLPMPANYPRYPSRQQMVDYLDAYARELRTPPRFGVGASTIARDGGGWRVDTNAGALAADNVVVATGNTRVPARPSWPGMDAYGGKLLHSVDYQTGADFRGQRVLVVGFGNSACEIAIDLSEQGASPTLAVRGAVNVIPRELFGIPIVSFGLLQQLTSPRFSDAVTAPILRAAVGDITLLGLRRLPYGPAVQVSEHQQIPLIDIGTIDLIRRGRIGVRPGIERFTRAGVAFADGAIADYDAVILATGFRPALADFLPDVTDVLDRDGAPLVSGGLTAAPGLFFCGFEVVPSGTLRQIGIEARAVAAHIAGRGR